MTASREQRQPQSEAPGATRAWSVLRRERLDAKPASARSARHLVADVCIEQGMPDLLEPAMLCTAEIVTNAIRYGQGGTVQLTISRSGRTLRVEVTDDNNRPPRVHAPAPEDPSGRGLMIVAAMARDWGSEPDDRGGKKVWFVLGAEKVARAS